MAAPPRAPLLALCALTLVSSLGSGCLGRPHDIDVWNNASVPMDVQVHVADADSGTAIFSQGVQVGANDLTVLPVHLANGHYRVNAESGGHVGEYTMSLSGESGNIEIHVGADGVDVGFVTP